MTTYWAPNGLVCSIVICWLTLWRGCTQTDVRSLSRMLVTANRENLLLRWEAKLKQPQQHEAWLSVSIVPGLYIQNNHTRLTNIYRKSLHNPQNQTQLLDDTQIHYGRKRGREKKNWPNIFLLLDVDFDRSNEKTGTKIKPDIKKTAQTKRMNRKLAQIALSYAWEGNPNLFLRQC